MANLEYINVQPLRDDVAPDYRPGRALHFRFLQSPPPGFPPLLTIGDGDGQVKQFKPVINVLIVVLGAEGIGKTSLENKVSHNIQDHGMWPRNLCGIISLKI